MYFYHVFEQLNKNNIRYLVVGGMAVNLHGFLRVTADLDIAIALDKGNLEKFVAMIKEMGWKPRIPVPLEDLLDVAKRESWYVEKNMKAFTLYNPKDFSETLDVLLKFSEEFDTVYERKVVMSPKGVSVPVISMDDLIKMKSAAGRQRDLFDIQGLSELREIAKNEYRP